MSCDFSKSNLFNRYPVLLECKDAIVESYDILKNSFSNGGKLIIMGNGGSSADAEHFCGELVKGFVLPRKVTGKMAEILNSIDTGLADHLQEGFPAISLGVSHSLVSAFANDKNWDYVFAQQVHVLANKNDVIFGISTSGNSPNVVNALKVAKSKGIRSILLTGTKKSEGAEVADVSIHTPGKYTHEIQELHLPIYHAISIELEFSFFDKE